MQPVLSLSKGDPAPDELAAIAAAYLILMRRGQTPAPSSASRWRLAGRPGADPDRFAVRTASRWKTAARSTYDRR
jgi:hypothetical protein